MTSTEYTVPLPPRVTKRGLELLDEVMDYIEAEHALEQSLLHRDIDLTRRMGMRWYQGMWGVANRDKVKTAIELGGGVSVLADDVGPFLGSIAIEPAVMASCGTACCLAGTTTLMVGDKAIVHDPASTDTFTGPNTSWDWVLTDEGTAEDISQRAAALLGLPYAEADVLFNGSNTIEDLRSMVAALHDGERLTDKLCPSCDEWGCPESVCTECNQHDEYGCNCDDDDEDEN